jgi:hypothetical protein
MIQKFTFFLFLSFLSACTFTDNDSFEPAFLLLDNATLTTKSNEGSSRHNIKYAWVIVDGQLLGIFPLPAKVPVITTSQAMNIQINAGVNFNGEANSSVEYPFFTPIKQTLLLEPNKEYKINVNYTYTADAVFDFIEDFEGSTHLFDNDIDGNSATRINFTDKEKTGGKKSGLLFLNNENKDGEFSTIPFFDNKNNKRGNVYLEFDYKSPEPIYVGTELNFKSSSKQSYTAQLPQSSEWIRTYVNLTKEISQNTVLEYRIIMGATKLNLSTEQSEIYFDNVKLVHF